MPRVLAIRELESRPNSSPLDLATSTKAIGIITLGTPLYGPSAQLSELKSAAWDAGYSVTIAPMLDATSDEIEAALCRLLDHGVDGVVVAGGLMFEQVTPSLFERVPALTVGDVFPRPPLLSVRTDQRNGARSATQHLLALGHDTVWHVGGPGAWPSALARLGGWLEVLTEAGAWIHAPIEGDWSAASGYQAGAILAAEPSVTAVFAANDQMAMGLMRALYERGRRIPEDISVIGFDDHPESAHTLIPLTTVRQGFAAVARHAIAELIQLMEGRTPTKDTITLPMDLIGRSSSGPPPELRRHQHPSGAGTIEATAPNEMATAGASATSRFQRRQVVPE